MATKKNTPIRNFNLYALQGDDTVDDMDVCETLGLDPKVAYTPAINDAAIQKMFNENIDGFMKKGMSEEEARAAAAPLASAAKAKVAAAQANQKFAY